MVSDIDRDLGHDITTFYVFDNTLELIASVDGFDGHDCLPLGIRLEWNVCQSTNGEEISERRKTEKLMKKCVSAGSGLAVKSSIQAAEETPPLPPWTRAQEFYCGGDSDQNGR